MTDLQTLIQQRQKLEEQIAAMQTEQRATAIANVKALMQQHGLSLSDLSDRQARVGTPSRKGGQVAAKYRNEATGDSWSGRGLKPKWLTAALAAGKKLEDFAV